MCIRDRRYSFRFKLVFQSGVSKSIQRGGFPTRKAAQLARDDALIQICRKQFVPYSYTVKEFYDYWLWYYMWDEKDISYNTYMTYRNIILNYIDPAPVSYTHLDVYKRQKSLWQDFWMKVCRVWKILLYEISGCSENV